MDSADYVIVGGGSAGCVLAARLSEDQGCEVALLEAGGEDQSPLIQEPSQWPMLWDSAYAWGYATSRQAGYNFRTIACPRGKVLGGSSSINAMIYIRGDRHDFDNWLQLGNDGWGWADVLPYFIKSEDQSRGLSPYHGVDGSLSVADAVTPHRLSQAFVDAAIACGHERNEDFNGRHLQGAGLYQLTARNGRRCSASDAFLQPARHRRNLTVLLQARALRLLFAGQRAAGVQYLRDGHASLIAARHEVILCAGSIDSPKLLLLSGIGGERQLRDHGIALYRNLPGVGKNLVDHPAFMTLFALRDAEKAPPTTNYAEAGLFFKSARSENAFAADLQFHVAPYSPPFAVAGSSLKGLRVVSVVCRPQSRGSVRLRSPDPLDPPVIDPGYMTDSRDFVLQGEAIQEARRIAASSPLAAHLVGELSPGAGAVGDAALERAIRMSGDCLWHPVGTCAMGGGPDAVVDAKLRVHGVSSLRVVDASVMPQITSGNTNAPTIMIAEKAAHLIRGST